VACGSLTTTQDIILSSDKVCVGYLMRRVLLEMYAMRAFGVAFLW
jgi:hypothetical protein